MATIGDKIDKFTLVRQLGAGGMGQTWEAVRQCGHDFEQRVAIKLADPEILETTDGVRAFRREAALAASLRHPNIASVLDVDDHAGYLVCELVDGADLRAVLRAAPGGRLEPDVVVHVVGQIARGLSHAHRRILRGRTSPVIHRDMSPGNVVIDYDGNIKIVDFGIAKAITGGADVTEAVKGKLSYMAPEQAMGARMDGRADQYALGVIAYEALTGVRPNDGAHEGETLSRILGGTHVPLSARAPQLDARFVDVIERMLALRPEQRFPSIAAMLEALARFTPPLTVHRRLIPLVIGARQPHTIMHENGRFVSRPVPSEPLLREAAQPDGQPEPQQLMAAGELAHRLVPALAAVGGAALAVAARLPAHLFPAVAAAEDTPISALAPTRRAPSSPPPANLVDVERTSEPPRLNPVRPRVDCDSANPAGPDAKSTKNTGAIAIGHGAARGADARDPKSAKSAIAIGHGADVRDAKNAKRTKRANGSGASGTDAISASGVGLAGGSDAKAAKANGANVIGAGAAHGAKGNAGASAGALSPQPMAASLRWLRALGGVSVSRVFWQSMTVLGAGLLALVGWIAFSPDALRTLATSPPAARSGSPVRPVGRAIPAPVATLSVEPKPFSTPTTNLATVLVDAPAAIAPRQPEPLELSPAEGAVARPTRLRVARLMAANSAANANLIETAASARIKVFPWGRVWIDQEARGAATPLLEVKLAPGKHVIAVGRENPIDAQTIEFKPGLAQEISFDLEGR
jgi:hypothetical protein